VITYLKKETPVKTKMATALSLIGVLGAGSAAALVNTEILDSGSAAATSSALVAPEEAPADDTGLLDQVNAALQEAQSGTESSPDSTPAPPAAASGGSTVPATTAPAPSQPTTFDVGDAGSVTLEVQGGRLTIVSASADGNWTVTKTEEDSDGDEIEVYFETATVRVEFTAKLSNGQIVPSVDATSLGSSPSAPAVQGPVSGDDDHDDMDEGGGDHDDMDDLDDDDHDDMDDLDDDDHDDHDDMDDDERDEDERDDD
jgi:hypothetical protein